MKKCPNCQKIALDADAAFCSACATALIECEPSEKQEKRETDGRSRRGLLICILIAICAVIAMYVYFDELGFERSKKEASAVSAVATKEQVF